MTSTSRAEYMRRYRAQSPMLASIPLDADTADALLRLVERSGMTRAELIRHLIRCADQDRDPMA